VKHVNIQFFVFCLFFKRKNILRKFIELKIKVEEEEEISRGDLFEEVILG